MSERPEITARTLAEAEKLAALELQESEREQALGGVGRHLRVMRARRTLPLGHAQSPATRFDPRLPGTPLPPDFGIVRTRASDGKVPARDDDLAFASVVELSGWLARGELRARRLAELYLERLERIGPALECVVGLCRERALAQADRADRELAAGQRRGPLHGIPWGAKDLLDTAGIATTWGSPPYRDRVPARDAEVVRRLDDAGAVLIAKLALGELAMDDVWFGGRTRNPWNPAAGSGGSSAGSGAAVAAGLVGFALGSETLGSIASPSATCGCVGLRPTFGRVPRTGAMPLAWTLDKLGPMTRAVEDAALVLDAIRGADAGDPDSLDLGFEFDATAPVGARRVGFDPREFEAHGAEGAALASTALEALRRAGVEVVPVEIPELPYAIVLSLLMVEAAAAHEEATLTNLDDRFCRQDAKAWPNALRVARFVPAVEYVQMQRVRRAIMEASSALFERIDALASPGLAQTPLSLGNLTGQPALTLRAGFRDDGTPVALTLTGRLYDEGTLLRIALALEAELGVWSRRPALG